MKYKFQAVLLSAVILCHGNVGLWCRTRIIGAVTKADEGHSQKQYRHFETDGWRAAMRSRVAAVSGESCM